MGPVALNVLFYDDPAPVKPVRPSVFLAGPTRRGARRTPWRAAALDLLEDRGFPGTVTVPEFRHGTFQDLAPSVFGSSEAVPGLSPVQSGVLAWETAGLASASTVLFWMPFGPDMPGLTTRGELARELELNPGRLVLGMPSETGSSSHVRYHAHRVGVLIVETLEQAVQAAIEKAGAA